MVNMSTYNLPHSENKNLAVFWSNEVTTGVYSEHQGMLSAYLVQHEIKNAYARDITSSHCSFLQKKGLF